MIFVLNDFFFVEEVFAEIFCLVMMSVDEDDDEINWVGDGW